MTAPDTPEEDATNTAAGPASSNLKDILTRLQRSVFEADESVVVALKGGWGEGKTHFWKQDVAKAHPEISIGYVSLFGAESLQEVRQRVVLAATPSLNPNSSAGGLFGTNVERFKRALNVAKSSLPEAISRFGVPASLTIQILEDQLLKPGWVLCLDDIERRSDSVETKTLLGYIDELRERRGLKVVLIYNQDRVGREDAVFQAFQEKVIDKEIAFNPDTKDILHLVFANISRIGQNPAILAELKRCCQVLNLRNIRLLKKIRHYYEDIVHELPDTPNTSFLDQVLYSLILFVWIRFARQDDNQPSFDLLCDDSVFIKHLGEDAFKDTEQEENKVKARKLLEDYGFRYTDDLDRILIDFVQTDTLDRAALLNEYESYANNESRGILAEKHSEVWRKYYHSTLQDTEATFCAELIAVTNDFMEYIPLHNLDETLIVLTKLDRNADAQTMLETFSAKREATISEFNSADLFQPIQHPGLKAVLDAAEKASDSDHRQIGEVIESAIKGDFTYSKDRERLAQFSCQEYVDYFTASDQKHLTTKLRKLGTIASRIANPDTYENNIQSTVREAAAEFATMSRINRLRMESMGLIEKQTTVEQHQED